MKFRRSRKPEVAEEAWKPEDESPELEPSPREMGRGRWSTAFLIVGSALMGATALALWNRRMIETMRAQIQAQSKLAVPPYSTDDEIF